MGSDSIRGKKLRFTVRIGIAVLVWLVSGLAAGRAIADSPSATVGAGTSSFNVGATQSTASTSSASPSSSTGSDPGHWEEHLQCKTGGEQTCDAAATCSDGSLMTLYQHITPDGTIDASSTNCPGDAKPKRGPSVADVRRAFKSIPMKPSPLHIQPPHGETLVNFDSIFYTDPTTIDRSLKLLGSTVDFHITVARYTWRFGDDQTEQTTDPGAAYPHQTITHRYLHKGTVRVSLDTTYQADYRIDAGPQQHLADTVTIVGAPQQLKILTATPHLVGS